MFRESLGCSVIKRMGMHNSIFGQSTRWYSILSALTEYYFKKVVPDFLPSCEHEVSLVPESLKEDPANEWLYSIVCLTRHFTHTSYADKTMDLVTFIFRNNYAWVHRSFTPN